MQGLGIDALGLASTCCPFGHDVKRAAEALRLEASPELGAVTRSCCPFVFEPGQMTLKRALADPEHVAALTAQNASDQTTAMARPADYVLNGDAVPGDGQDGGVRIPTAQIALILQALGGAQQIGVDGHGADRSADLAHLSTHRIEERTTGIFHQVPAVGDLNGVRKSLGRSTGIGAATVAGDDGNLRLLGKPGLRGRGLAGSRLIGRRRSRSRIIVP